MLTLRLKLTTQHANHSESHFVSYHAGSKTGTSGATAQLSVLLQGMHGWAVTMGACSGAQARRGVDW